MDRERMELGILIVTLMCVFLMKDGFCKDTEQSVQSVYSAKAELFQHNGFDDKAELKRIEREIKESRKLEKKERVKKEKAICVALNKSEKLTKEDDKEASITKAQVLSERELPGIKELTQKDVKVKTEKEDLAKEEKIAETREVRREVIAEPVRPGFERYYNEGAGFKLTKFLGFAAYSEIYEEPNPVDDYISEIKESRYFTSSRADEDAMRDMITPLFTRAYAVKAIFDYKDWPRLTYTFDKREVLHEFDTKYAIKDQRWQTQEVDVLYTMPKLKYIGVITLNPVYKRIVLTSEDDTNTAEDRNEYILNLTLTPFENFEIYGQVDYYEGKKLNTTWVSKPEQWLYKSEIRLRFPNYKLSITPGYSFSQTRYLPKDDMYTKEEMYVDIGKDLTNKLNLSSKSQWTLSETIWPRVGRVAWKGVEADVFEIDNKVSYNLFTDYYINGKLDYAHGMTFDGFDNVGIGIEGEYFKSTFLRGKIGYERYQYYNIDKDIDTVYFKIYFFM